MGCFWRNSGFPLSRVGTSSMKMTRPSRSGIVQTMPSKATIIDSMDCSHPSLCSFCSSRQSRRNVGTGCPNELLEVSIPAVNKGYAPFKAHLNRKKKQTSRKKSAKQWIELIDIVRKNVQIYVIFYLVRIALLWSIYPGSSADLDQGQLQGRLTADFFHLDPDTDQKSSTFPYLL